MSGREREREIEMLREHGTFEVFERVANSRSRQSRADR